MAHALTAIQCTARHAAWLAESGAKDAAPGPAIRPSLALCGAVIAHVSATLPDGALAEEFFYGSELPGFAALREFVGYEAIREDARARHASLQGGGEAGAPVSDGSRKRE